MDTNFAKRIELPSVSYTNHPQFPINLYICDLYLAFGVPDSLLFHPKVQQTAAFLQTSDHWTTECMHQLAQAPWTRLMPRRLGASATNTITLYSCHWHHVQTILILYDFDKASITFNSHQRGWPSWPPQTSHTLSADLRDIHSAPVDLPTKDHKD